MKIKQVMTTSVHRRTFLGPKAVISHPFKIVPKIEPIPLP
jgi:hypothetical protein